MMTYALLVEILTAIWLLFFSKSSTPRQSRIFNFLDIRMTNLPGGGPGVLATLVFVNAILSIHGVQLQ